MAYTCPTSNECTTSVNGSDLRFSFQYDSATDKLGCLDSNGDFYPFNQGGGGIDTSDATAYARNIEKGYTAYARGQKITGTKTMQHSIQKYTTTSVRIGNERAFLAATSIGDYALFGGGKKYTTSSTVYDSVNCVNSLLSASAATNLSEARESLGATSNPSYAIFGPGIGGSDVNKIDAYNSSLSKTQLWNGTFRYQYGATYIGDYALFGGGRTYSGTTAYYDIVDAYNTSLSKSNAPVLSSRRAPVVATTVGDYALFGGGYIDGSTITDQVDAYNSSFTKSLISFSSARKMSAATAILDRYALFGYGHYSSDYKNITDAFNTSLVRTSVTTSQYVLEGTASTSTGDFALFAGGKSYSQYYLNVECYNSYLTMSTATGLTNYRNYSAGVSVGDCALFGGGYYMVYDNYYNYNTVDIYYED